MENLALSSLHGESLTIMRTVSLNQLIIGAQPPRRPFLNPGSAIRHGLVRIGLYISIYIYLYITNSYSGRFLNTFCTQLIFGIKFSYSYRRICTGKRGGWGGGEITIPKKTED